MKKKDTKKGDKLNPKYYVITGFERDENGIIIVDDEWREFMRRANNAADPTKNKPLEEKDK